MGYGLYSFIMTFKGYSSMRKLKEELGQDSNTSANTKVEHNIGMY